MIPCSNRIQEILEWVNGECIADIGCDHAYVVCNAILNHQSKKGYACDVAQGPLDNAKKTIDILKKIILRSYGEKDPETGSFEKSDDIAIRFSKTDAFSELFYELAYNEEAAQSFFMGLIPVELRAEAEKKMAEMNPKEPRLVQLPPTDN